MGVDFCPVLCIPKVAILQAFRGIRILAIVAVLFIVVIVIVIIMEIIKQYKKMWDEISQMFLIVSFSGIAVLDAHLAIQPYSGSER